MGDKKDYTKQTIYLLAEKLHEGQGKIKELENTVDDIIEYCRVTDKISRKRAWMSGARRRYDR